MSNEQSLQAYESIKPTAATLRQRVLNFIQESGRLGATADEIELHTGIAGNTVRPRLCELEGRGEVHRSNRTRKTTSGRAAGVWLAAA